MGEEVGWEEEEGRGGRMEEVRWVVRRLRRSLVVPVMPR